MARPVVLVTVRSFGSGFADPARRLHEAGLDPREGAIDHDLAALRSTLARAVAWVAGGAPRHPVLPFHAPAGQAGT